MPKSLDKPSNTLSELFIKCHTQQRSLGESVVEKSLFVEYFLSVTRQSKVTVTAASRQSKVVVTVANDGDNIFAECLAQKYSAKIAPIVPVHSFCTECPTQRHSTNIALIVTVHSFCVECVDTYSAKTATVDPPCRVSLSSVRLGTRQRCTLCRVSWPYRLAKQLS